MIAGRYSLDREIGRGGMGAVWLGRDEVLGRRVALKRIGLLPAADRADLARAEREARLSARLNHPHVVAVFDFVVDADTDARWLVMEYVEGSTLSQLVQRGGRLSPDAAAPLLWQAADALVAAHAAGIVHRDVKPSNILVEPGGRVKLGDFGIARISADPSLTQTGLVVGSPAYLAPEVATGERGDEAVDVWSLGATAYYVLSGRAPYDFGDHLLSGLYRMVNQEPPRLADAGWLTPLLAGTMVRDPSRRASMTQVRDFLAGHTGRMEPATQDGPFGFGWAEEATPTARLGAVPAAVAPAPSQPPVATPRPRRTTRSRLRVGVPVLLVVALALVLALGLVLRAGLRSGGPTADVAGPGASSAASSRTAAPSPSPSPSVVPAKPTVAGMTSFIRGYVSAVASDPDTSWQMLTPRFQRQSGGLDTYRRFWSRATNGRVLDISADPRTLTVSYQVRFDDFRNGPGPTVLDLAFSRGRYLIDGEQTVGFVPAG
ncbi:MAG: serine/threonine-protein kinase [Nocardioidaceae bacterium]